MKLETLFHVSAHFDTDHHAQSSVLLKATWRLLNTPRIPEIEGLHMIIGTLISLCSALLHEALLRPVTRQKDARDKRLVRARSGPIEV
jgi:hypothetical protein